MKKPSAPFDIDVGKRIRVLRVEAGLSQEKVADALGMTFQQVQKYEKGVNRIAPSRLKVLSKLFKVPVAAFFGEDGKGDGIDLDMNVNTTARREIIKELERINSTKTETALMQLLRSI